VQVFTVKRAASADGAFTAETPTAATTARTAAAKTIDAYLKSETLGLLEEVRDGVIMIPFGDPATSS
jgi:hypothetical protein